MLLSLKRSKTKKEERQPQSEMTSSNECPSEDQQGTEDPSNCFLPPDPHPVHSTTSNIDGIIFDPSHNDAVMPSTSSKRSPEASTSSIKKSLLSGKRDGALRFHDLPNSTGKAAYTAQTVGEIPRKTPEDDKLTAKALIERKRKRREKAEEDEKTYNLLTSLIHHSGSGLTNISSLNVLLSSKFSVKILELTVSYLSTNIRVNIAESEKFYGIFHDVSKFFGLNAGEFHLMFNGQRIKARDTPKTHGMPDRATIKCIPLNQEVSQDQSKSAKISVMTAVDSGE